jgi:hypothetical protein
LVFSQTGSVRISRRSFLGAGLSAGALAALAACGSTVPSKAKAKPLDDSAGAEIGPLPSAPPDHPRTKFAMVGDSITRASSKPLTSVLETLGFVQIDIDAEVSRRIDVGDGRAEPLAGVKTMRDMIDAGVAPDVWAVGLGTNDVGKYKDAAEYAALIDEMMSIPDPDLPMIWVDVYNPNQLAATQMFNLVLRDRARARGNATVLSWFALASDPKQKILRSDHVHPNEQGTLVFADLVGKALS